MRLTRFPSVDEFLQRSRDFLLAREAEHNLILGLATTIKLHPERYEEPPYLATVEDTGRVVAVTLRTPPHNLVLSRVSDDAALDVIASALQETYATLPGVTGPSELSRAFAERWEQQSKQRYRLSMAQRIYQLDAVTPPAPVPGVLRRAILDDQELIVAWYTAFMAEAEGDTHPERIERAVQARLRAAEAAFYFWIVDGRPVSLAGYGSPTPHGNRVGPVYTPPAERRRGYASACVSALSQLLLDNGRRFCFLFTDLANPTSNHIYQTIGYRPVCDVDVYTFDEADPVASSGST